MNLGDDSINLHITLTYCETGSIKKLCDIE